MTPAAPAGYASALARAAFVRLPDSGYLRIQGADRRDFLQRQSTNDVSSLVPDRVLVTVLTSPTARILDVLTLFEEGPEAIAALSLPGQAAGTYNYLKSRVFFMDKVSIENASPGFAQMEMIGPQAVAILQRLGLQNAPAPGELVHWESLGTTIRLFQETALGLRLLLPAQDAGQVEAALEEAGAEPLSLDTYTILRVEAGVPAAGAELTQEFTPLETGLGWAVSDSKGCYTGQEIIARQLTYDKVTQRLVGLSVGSQASPGERLLSAGEGRPAGRLTSAAISPRFGPIALAIVRRPYDSPGTRLAFERDPQAEVAVVSTLPFSISDS